MPLLQIMVLSTVCDAWKRAVRRAPKHSSTSWALQVVWRSTHVDKLPNGSSPKSLSWHVLVQQWSAVSASSNEILSGQSGRAWKMRNSEWVIVTFPTKADDPPPVECRAGDGRCKSPAMSQVIRDIHGWQVIPSPKKPWIMLDLPVPNSTDVWVLYWVPCWGYLDWGIARAHKTK